MGAVDFAQAPTLGNGQGGTLNPCDSSGWISSNLAFGKSVINPNNENYSYWRLDKINGQSTIKVHAMIQIDGKIAMVPNTTNLNDDRLVMFKIPTVTENPNIPWQNRLQGFILNIPTIKVSLINVKGNIILDIRSLDNNTINSLSQNDDIYLAIDGEIDLYE